MSVDIFTLSVKLPNNPDTFPDAVISPDTLTLPVANTSSTYKNLYLSVFVPKSYVESAEGIKCDPKSA